MPGTDDRQAQKVAQRVVEAVSRESLRHDASELSEKVVTVSAGIGTSVPGDTPESLKLAADGALYIAKKAGRNCVAGLKGICLL